MTEFTATPYVPGHARGPVSRDPVQAGAILLVAGDKLPATIRADGIVVVDGAMFSHPMLGLLAKGIPAVIATAAQAAELQAGQVVRLDGYTGLVADLAAMDSAQLWPPLAPPPGQPVISADGVAVALQASVRDAASAAQAKVLGAQSIGLVRSEYLAPADGSVPDGAFYRQAFGDLLAAADPLRVTLRLLDIAADKVPAWLPRTVQGGGALGLQGMRLFDQEPVQSLVAAQIDAVARLDVPQRLGLLVPYVTTVEELRLFRERIRERVELPIGAMIETPAAALEVAGLLETADFAALGTNDLMQCLFAADRDSAPLQHYLDPYAPLLYRFLAQIAREADRQLPRLQMCGLLSQLPGVLPVLLGLGFRSFTVGVPYIPYLAATVRQTRIAEAVAFAEEVCRSKSRSEVQALLDGRYLPAGPS